MNDILLQALRVPVILLDALGARGARSRALVALATALSPLLSNSSARSRGRLGDGSHGRLRRCSDLGRSGHLGRSGNLGGSWGGHLGRGSRSRSGSAGTVPDLGTRNRVARESTVDVEKHTGCVGGEITWDGDTGRESSSAGSTNLYVDLKRQVNVCPIHHTSGRNVRIPGRTEHQRPCCPRAEQ